MELTLDQAMQLLKVEDAKLKDLEARINQTMAVLNELQVAKATLKNVPKKETVGLLPIGGGVMLPAKTKKGNVLINVGAGVVIEKNIEGSVEFLERRIKMLEDSLTKLSQLAQKTDKNIYVLKTKIDEVIRNKQQTPTIVG